MVKKQVFGLLLIVLLMASLLASLICVNVDAQSSHIVGSISASGGGALQEVNNQIVGSIFNMPVSGVISNMTVYLQAYDVAVVTAKVAVYNNDSLTLVAETAEREIDMSLGTFSTGWYTLNFTSPVSLDGDSYYLFALWCSVDVGSGNVFMPKVVGSTNQARTVYAVYNSSYPATLTPTASASYAFPLYSIYGDNVYVSSSPEIATSLTVDAVSGYSTPSYFSLDDDNHTFLVEQSKVYGGNAYNFTQWIVNGTLNYYDLELTLNITAPTNITAVYSEYSGLFNFYGPYDELTGELLNENVTVTAHYANGTDIPDYSFVLNGTWVYPPDYEVQYFEYLFEDNSTRQYWVDPSEVITSMYVFKGNSTSSYVINFLDYTGVLETYPFVTAKAYINGSLWTVEKRTVDEQGSMIMNLINGEKYSLTVGNAENSFVYGDLLMTDTLGVQLYLKGVDFPKETLLMYKYINLYATRDYSTNSILFVYNDTKLMTESVTLTFTDLEGNIAHTYSIAATDAFQYNWTTALNWTSYQLVVDVSHEDYGVFDWRQFFPNVNGEGAAMFSFNFLGDWGFDLTYLIPAILILFAAGCFSALNAEVGALVMSVMAIILTWMGWIPIPAGALVAGFSLSILMALVYNKRRSQGL